MAITVLIETCYPEISIDDASRFVVLYDLFDSATSENAVKMLKEAIKKVRKACCDSV